MAVALNYYICILIFMSSRNIAVQKSVYDALNREKRVGESFTQLFRRLLDQRGGLGELAGAWGRGPARRERAALKLLRRRGGRR
jgi:predicted CopG family antitoxin